MPPANAGAFGTPFVQYRAGARRNCFDAGDPIQRVYFPTSCLISLVVSTGEGEQVETGMIGREGAAGLQSARGPRCSFARAIVQVPGESYTVSGGMQVRLTQKFPGEMLGIRRTSVTCWHKARRREASSDTLAGGLPFSTAQRSSLAPANAIRPFKNCIAD